MKRSILIGATGIAFLLGGCSGPNVTTIPKGPADKSPDQKNVVRGLRCTLSANKRVVRSNEDVNLSFQLHNETDEPIRFVFARGRHDPWGSAAPVVTDPKGQPVRLSWLMPAYVGAGRRVLSIGVVPARGTWKTSITLGPWHEPMKARWIPGIYKVRVRFQVNSRKAWLGGKYETFTRPFGLDALRKAADGPFWAGQLLSEPIEFTCRENHTPKKR